MKNHLDQTFKALKKDKKKALIFYMTAGYPKFPEQSKLVTALDKSGANILEIGIPFSDPIADGPTIQFSSEQALKNRVTLRSLLKWTKSMRSKVSMPFVLMGYLNPILAYGLKTFAKDAQKAGVSGVIIPDFIPEEAEKVEKILKAHNIHVVYLVAPTTPAKRQKMIASRTGGFLYAVSVAGVTGARKTFSAQTKTWLSRLGKMTKVPVCVGFGLSKPDHLRALKKNVDGFIVGSALINLIRDTKKSLRVKKVKAFTKRLAKEC